MRKEKGKGKYRGHTKTKEHDDLNKGFDEKGKRVIKQESHHAPSDDISPLAKKDGPALQMDRVDHQKTSSHGTNGNDAREYRKYIKELLGKGEWRNALAEEIRDIRDIAKETGDKRKYDEAIKEMLGYFKCLEAHNLLP